MKLFIPLAVVCVIGSVVGLYLLEQGKPTPIPVQTTSKTPTPKAVITPVQTTESLDAILRATDPSTAAEQSAATTAEVNSADTSLSAGDKSLKSLNTQASTYVQ